MRYLIILVVSIFVFIPGIGFAQTTWYVPDDFPTIQGAISDISVVNEDTIIVRAGTYVENINFLGKAITVKSEDGPDSTVIDGKKSGSVATFRTSETLNSILEGFTITNGSGTYGLWGGYPSGGGIVCVGSSPTLRNNIITANEAGLGGGIACFNYASPLITKNSIYSNTAKGTAPSSGGGIASGNSSPVITYNMICNNQAPGIGGTPYGSTGGGIGGYWSGSLVISNNIIIENTAEYGGGIMLYDNTSADISNNVVSDNTATGGKMVAGSYGGGLHVSLNSSAMIVNNMVYRNFADYGASGIGITDSASADIVNNTIYGNTADPAVMGGGAGIGLWTSGKATVVNTILWNNDAPKGPEICLEIGSTLDFSYSNVEGGEALCYADATSTLNCGAGNIDSDPLFVDETNDDFHLTFNSPCRGSGDNSAVPPELVEDFEGDGRCCYGTVDMGSDEFFTHLYWTGDATPGGIVEFKFVGLPGTTPVLLFISTGVLDPPLKTMWGDWYLAFPFLGQFDMGKIPSPEGILILKGQINSAPPPPYSFAMQAGIGSELTNLCIFEVK